MPDALSGPRHRDALVPDEGPEAHVEASTGEQALDSLVVLATVEDEKVAIGLEDTEALSEYLVEQCEQDVGWLG